jgi:hypothetical protein
METLLRRPTKTTPYVHLDVATRTFVIAGRSIPIDAEVFYAPILNWLVELDKLNEVNRFEFCFRFDFFNIASSKRVLFILYKLLEMQQKGKVVSIKWMYDKDDEDMLEIGQDFSVMIDNLQFKFESYDAAAMRKKDLMIKFG